MRAWLVVCAALALAPCRPTGAAAAAHAHRTHVPDPHRLERIKSQILAKLGLSSRPTPLGAPPRDVVRQILARAADPRPAHRHHDRDNEHAMREIIAIAHRVSRPYIPDGVGFTSEVASTCNPLSTSFTSTHKRNNSGNRNTENRTELGEVQPG